MRIAVSHCGNERKQPVYMDWLRTYAPDAELVIVAHPQGHVPLDGFDGLVLTGGEDVDPVLSKAEPVALVETTDRSRDDFEFALLDSAMDHHLPVLGICRGLQLTNVYLGGTLIADLPHSGFPAHTAASGAPELRHSVTVAPGSLLHAVVGSTQGEINSYHHQAVLRPAEQLVVSARSADGVPEAMEWKHREGRPFLLLVQWHPERMTGRTDPFTAAVAEAFFAEVRTTLHA